MPSPVTLPVTGALNAVLDGYLTTGTPKATLEALGLTLPDDLVMNAGEGHALPYVVPSSAEETENPLARSKVRRATSATRLYRVYDDDDVNATDIAAALVRLLTDHEALAPLLAAEGFFLQDASLDQLATGPEQDLDIPLADRIVRVRYETGPLS